MRTTATFRTPLLIALAGLVLVLAATFIFPKINPNPAATNERAELDQSAAPARAEHDTTPRLIPTVIPANPADYPDLIRQALRTPGPQAQNDIAAVALAWMDRDLPNFMSFVDELEVDDEDGTLWATLAPALMSCLPDVSEQTAQSPALLILVERLISDFAVTDPVQALAWAREWLLDSGLDSALSEIAPELAASDPGAATALVAEIAAPPKRLEAARGVGFVLRDADPDFALVWVDSLTQKVDRAYALSGVIGGMAKSHPSRAGSVFAERTETMQMQFTEDIRSDREVSGTSLSQVYEGLDPDAAAAAEANLPDPTIGYVVDAAAAVGSTWAQQDPGAALAWARSLAASRGRGEALVSVYDAWMASAPEAAYRAYQSESIRDSALANTVFEKWATDNPMTAARAALALAPGVERSAAVEGVTRGWIDSGAQPDAVAKWSAGLPLTEERDRTRLVIASEVADDDPVFAWSQAKEITNQTKRNDAFREVFPGLVEVNPQIAQRALVSTTLPTVEIEYYQSMIAPSAR